MSCEAGATDAPVVLYTNNGEPMAVICGGVVYPVVEWGMACIMLRVFEYVKEKNVSVRLWSMNPEIRIDPQSDWHDVMDAIRNKEAYPAKQLL